MMKTNKEDFKKKEIKVIDFLKNNINKNKMSYSCIHSNFATLKSAEHFIKPIVKTVNGKEQWFIYYHIVEKYLSKDFDKYKMISSIDLAFKTWREVFKKLNIEITIEPSSNAEESAILLRFLRNGHPDLPIPFNPTTIAYAVLPFKGNNLGQGADIYFNDDMPFSEMFKPEHIQLRYAAEHEAGHAIGLLHVTNPKGLMYDKYPQTEDYHITKETLEVVSNKYKDYIVAQEKYLFNVTIAYPTCWSVYTNNRITIEEWAKSFGLPTTGTKFDLAKRVFNKIHS